MIASTFTVLLLFVMKPMISFLVCPFRYARLNLAKSPVLLSSSSSVDEKLVFEFDESVETDALRLSKISNSVSNTPPSWNFKLETDYLGMVNFCLKPSDNALSGPSPSKMLNKLTNSVFKAITIGFKPEILKV